MIDLFERMFGDKFWNNTIIEVTKWAYDKESIKTRGEEYPPKSEMNFTKEINELLQEDFSLPKNHTLPSVFIDTHYEKDDDFENKKFLNETEKLFKFANKSKGFECKDIETALTEIKKLTNQIESKDDKIKNLTEENELLQNQQKEKERRQECEESGWKSDKCKGPRPQKIIENGFDTAKFLGFGIGMLIAGKLSLHIPYEASSNF